MAFCLPKFETDKFIEALKKGKVNPEKLATMDSAGRNKFFSDLLGEQHASDVNSLFESKLLLKNQQAGMIAWAKKLSGITEAARTDIVSKIGRMDRVLSAADEQTFLNDLASKKLGTDVSFEEAQHIVELSRQVDGTKQLINPDSPIGSKERLDYGSKKVALQNFVNDLKLENDKRTFGSTLQEFKSNPLKATLSSASELAGVAKGLKASLDDSAIFRQGWKTLFTNPKIWGENAAKSFVDIAKQLGKKPSDSSVIDGIKSEIYSRPNAIDGTYERMKLDVGTGEEAYPTTLPEKIPLFGRLYKASETAYQGFLYRMRADIADKVLIIADESGVDITNKEQAQSIGKLVNSLTGRGDLGKLETIGKTVNNLFFSPKALKANFDFLTAHQLQKDVTPFVRKQAIVNLVKVATGVTTILGIAKALNPNSVEFDPRSPDFGKIKVGNTRFDMTAGMSSLITLTARTLSRSTKSGNKISPLNSGKFGASTVGDVLWDFSSNKLSPAASVINDVWLKGKDFQGNKPTAVNEAQNLLVPLPITNIQELLSTPNAANVWIAGIADALGIATNTYAPKKK